MMAILDHYATSQRGAGLFSTQTLKTFLNYLVRANETAQQRHDLQKLDEHMLKDIGLTREQAEKEVKRDFWDLPRK